MAYKTLFLNSTFAGAVVEVGYVSGQQRTSNNNKTEHKVHQQQIPETIYLPSKVQGSVHAEACLVRLWERVHQMSERRCACETGIHTQRKQKNRGMKLQTMRRHHCLRKVKTYSTSTTKAGFSKQGT